MAAFKAGHVHVLIVTDVLARGLDVPVQVAVVNYDTPFRDEAYVHRVGRTARALQAGEAYTLGTWEELGRWSRMRARLQGGHIEPKKLQPPASAVALMVPAVTERLEAIRLRKTKADQRGDRRLDVRLADATNDQALALLRQNK